MTNKETINRNIGLNFDFLRQVLKDPSILDKIPDGSTLEFIEKDFSKIEKKYQNPTPSVNICVLSLSSN